MVLLNDCDKGKLRVLIKMILLTNSPKKMSANQLANRITEYHWAFRTDINSAKIGKLLREELNRSNKSFMSSCIKSHKRGNIFVYSIPVSNKEYA